jgi:hypothetical protein
MTWYPTRPSKPLTLLQVNVGKNDTSHEIALDHAHTEKVDILLIQEPYIYKELPRRITKWHPSYECFTPTDDWTSGKPRVLTYVRKKAGLQTSQVRLLADDCPALPDILFLHVSSPTGASLLVANVYNAPPGSIRASEAAKALIHLPITLFSQPSFLAGDLNLLHHRWQPSLQDGRRRAYAEEVVSWLDQAQLVLNSEPDIPTHDCGNVLDLAFVSSSLALNGASTTIASDLDVTSDHRSLLSRIPWDQRYSEPTRKLRFDTLDQPLFLSLLASNLMNVETPEPNEESLDAVASSLSKAIHSAYQGAAKRSLGQTLGQPWWNDNCRQTRELYRAGDCTKRDFRNAIRSAKRQFWQHKLDSATQLKDVFSMSKWHKSTGNFRSPPLKDPRFPTSLLLSLLLTRGPS